MLSTYIILIHERTSFSLLLRLAEAAEAAAAAKGGGEGATGGGGGGCGDKSWQTFLFFSRFLEKSWRQLRKKDEESKRDGEGRERL